MRYIKYITASMLITYLLIANYAFAEDPLLIPLFPKDDQQVLFKQPNGPFAVMVFEEFALGLHFGVIYYKQMGNPADGKWWISERFWQEKPWNQCITSLHWSSSGGYLYVGTSEVYGDGGSFKLDLFNKTYSRLYPKNIDGLKDISSTKIIGTDTVNQSLVIEVKLADYKTVTIVKIPVD